LLPRVDFVESDAIVQDASIGLRQLDPIVQSSAVDHIPKRQKVVQVIVQSQQKTSIPQELTLNVPEATCPQETALALKKICFWKRALVDKLISLGTNILVAVVTLSRGT
jgi:hypothetical protein